MLGSFLPLTHAVLMRPTTDRGQQMLDTWKLAMQASREAAERADRLRVPSFHWARVYRI